MGTDLHTPIPAGFFATGDYRPPRKGEWYLSKRQGRAIRALYDFSNVSRFEILQRIDEFGPMPEEPEAEPEPEDSADYDQTYYPVDVELTIIRIRARRA